MQMVPSNWKKISETLLLDRGATTINHPGGNLFAHLCRVAAMLESWGAVEDLQAAGLCHACYGTDGFPTAILDLAERSLLTETIGTKGEAIVYLYDSCDRGALYPQFGVSDQLLVTDRFTSASSLISESSARLLLELTAANELDLVLVHPTAASAWAPDFRRLLLRARRWLSPRAVDAWNAALPPD
jgi:hypothetical protein